MLSYSLHLTRLLICTLHHLNTKYVRTCDFEGGVFETALINLSEVTTSVQSLFCSCNFLLLSLCILVDLVPSYLAFESLLGNI